MASLWAGGMRSTTEGQREETGREEWGLGGHGPHSWGEEVK